MRRVLGRIAAKDAQRQFLQIGQLRAENHDLANSESNSVAELEFLISSNRAAIDSYRLADFNSIMASISSSEGSCLDKSAYL